MNLGIPLLRVSAWTQEEPEDPAGFTDSDTNDLMHRKCSAWKISVSAHDRDVGSYDGHDSLLASSEIALYSSQVFLSP